MPLGNNSLCNKRRQLVVLGLKSKVIRTRNCSARAKWPPHLNTQLTRCVIPPARAFSGCAKGMWWSGEEQALQDPLSPFFWRVILLQMARTVNYNWLKRELTLKNLLSLCVWCECVCMWLYVWVHMYACHNICMEARRYSEVSPFLLPCLRQGLRDALSVTIVDLQASGKASLSTSHCLHSSEMADATALSIYIGFVDPNLGAHPCLTNAATHSAISPTLKTPFFWIFSPFSNVLFLLSYDVQRVCLQKRKPSMESQSVWLWRVLSIKDLMA